MDWKERLWSQTWRDHVRIGAIAAAIIMLMLMVLIAIVVALISIGVA